jgi:hypothetical protein
VYITAYPVPAAGKEFTITYVTRTANPSKVRPLVSMMEIVSKQQDWNCRYLLRLILKNMTGNKITGSYEAL